MPSSTSPKKTPETSTLTLAPDRAAVLQLFHERCCTLFWDHDLIATLNLSGVEDPTTLRACKSLWARRGHWRFLWIAGVKGENDSGEPSSFSFDASEQFLTSFWGG